jgi:hypothetical protein
MLRGTAVKALVTLSGSRIVFAAYDACSLHVWNVAATAAALPQASAHRAGAVKQLAALATGRVLSISTLDPHVHLWSAHGMRLLSLAGTLPALFDDAELQECADGCFAATTSSVTSFDYRNWEKPSDEDPIITTHMASAHVWTVAGALLCEDTLVTKTRFTDTNKLECFPAEEVLQLLRRLHTCSPRAADDVRVLWIF